jgi:hypothetical protein
VITSLRAELIKIGAKLVNRGRNVMFQIAEVAAPPQTFHEIPSLVTRARPAPA